MHFSVGHNSRFSIGIAQGFPGGSDNKESACNAGDPGSTWVRKIPWRRKWKPTPVLLPGEFHGQRSLAGYSPRGCRELDTTEQLSLSFITKASCNETVRGSGRCDLERKISLGPLPSQSQSPSFFSVPLLPFVCLCTHAIFKHFLFCIGV